MKRKIYILIAIVVVLLCIVGFGKNNGKQKSLSESKEENVKSVPVSVADIKAMYKDWTIEEKSDGIKFNTFENDERNYLAVHYFLEGSQCRAVRYHVALNGYKNGHAENIKKLSEVMTTIPMIDAFKFNGVSEEEFQQMKKESDNEFSLSKENLKIKYYVKDMQDDMPFLIVTVKP